MKSLSMKVLMEIMPQFYTQVKEALSGGSWPVTTDEALSVAKIIDLARLNSIRK